MPKALNMLHRLHVIPNSVLNRKARHQSVTLGTPCVHSVFIYFINQFAYQKLTQHIFSLSSKLLLRRILNKDKNKGEESVLSFLSKSTEAYSPAYMQ